MVRRNMMIRVFLMITVITSNGLAFNFSDMYKTTYCSISVSGSAITFPAKKKLTTRRAAPSSPDSIKCNETDFKERYVKQTCWGYLVELTIGSSNETRFFYINFYDEKAKEELLFTPLTGVKYIVNITALPTKSHTTVVDEAPDECERPILTHIHSKYLLEKKKEKNKECSDVSDTEKLRKLRSIAREICKSSDKSKEQRKSMAKSVILDNRFGQCVLRLPKKNQRTSLKSNAKMEAILFSVAGFLCLLVIIFIAVNLRKSKRRSMICLKEKLQREDRLISDTMRIKAESVLIIYPHGCRILHRLLRDVAAIISSYGIHVHLALLESSKLDGTGGISRFYEETISNSSYTLVLCTETSGPQLIQHKPYMFALRIISGQAFYSNDNSAYIPVYIGTFEKNKDNFPNFLVETNKTGFGLPNDLQNLLTYLLANEEVTLNSDIQQKNKIYRNCIKALSKSYQESTHSDCNKKECKKGTLGASSASSTLFASMKTVNGDKPDLLNLAMEATIFGDRRHTWNDLVFENL